MSGKRVLVVAAHPDDEVLGCGGTIARHVMDGDEVRVLVVAEGVTSRSHAGKDEVACRMRQCKEAAAAIGVSDMHFLGFADQRLDTIPLLDIIQAIERYAADLKPSVVYTHHGGDLNADHRVVCRAAVTAFRPVPGQSVRSIYAFEILSSTDWTFGLGEPFLPNYFVDISATLDRKVKALRCYGSEIREFPHTRSYESLAAHAQRRGAQVGCRNAEAFCVIRELV